MKLSAAQITSFLKKPDSGVRVILIYGPNTGLVSERAESLAGLLVPDKNDPFAVSRLTGGEVKESPSRLYDEAASLSLMGGRRLVRLQQAVESNTAALDSFLKDPPACESVILIEGGDLDKRSKLRALCEAEGALTAAIPCYIEDAAARQRTIVEHLQSVQLRVAPEVSRLLVDVLPTDRLAMRQELDKLVLYMGGAGEVTLDVVRTIISDAAGAEVDDWVQAVAEGQSQKALRLFDHLVAEQTAMVTLLRAMQRHVMRLQVAKAHMASGLGVEAAMKKLSPPVFWKQVDPMKRQLARWSLERTEVRLAQLMETEAAVKRTGTPDVALCAHLFLSMAVRP